MRWVKVIEKKVLFASSDSLYASTKITFKTREKSIEKSLKSIKSPNKLCRAIMKTQAGTLKVF